MIYHSQITHNGVCMVRFFNALYMMLCLVLLRIGKNIFTFIWWFVNLCLHLGIVKRKKIEIMTVQEIKTIKMGTILTWNPTGELFKVTGFNEFKIKDGTEVKVSGIECDSDARYSQESMPSIYNLSKSSFYVAR